MLVLLVACARPEFERVESCQPERPEAGTTRAKQIVCGDEALEGSEGGVGDWLIETATATFIVRGVYSSLTMLDEPGGTVIDAALRDAALVNGPDLLTEYRPDGDRGSIEAATGGDWAELRLPGVTYRVEAGVDSLKIDSPGGVLVPGTFRDRVGGIIRREPGEMLGVDGFVAEGGAAEGGVARVEGVTRIGLSEGALWPEGVDVAGEVDADAVLVVSGGVAVDRLPVVDGTYAARVPAGATLVPEREGCTYGGGMALLGCVGITVRVTDDDGRDLRSTVGNALGHWVLPPGGGIAWTGDLDTERWLWAGPGYGALLIPAGAVEASAQLPRVVPEDVVLVDLAREIAPDVDARWWSTEAMHDATGENIDMVVVLADDDVASLAVDRHDDVLGDVASRVGGDVWGWHFSGNGGKPAHGAVKHGFGALDRLTLMRGGISTDRFTVVSVPWVEAARAQAAPRDWPTSPDFLWLASFDELPVLVALLDDWMDVVPVGPRTWVDVRGALNLSAIERGLLEGDVSAGSGPRVRIDRVGEGEFRITVNAPAWMAVNAVEIVTPTGARAVRTTRGVAFVRVPAGTPWVLATVTGAHAQPWSAEPAWAVSAPLWL